MVASKATLPLFQAAAAAGPDCPECRIPTIIASREAVIGKPDRVLQRFHCSKCGRDVVQEVGRGAEEASDG